MNLFNWVPGRQGGGYRKLCLWQGASWDLYVIDYPVGAAMQLHTDEVEGHEHHRINLVLWGDPDAFESYSVGPGTMTLDERPRWARRLVIFRPDQQPHGLGQLRRRRVVLSLGWTKRGDARRDWEKALDSLEQHAATNPRHADILREAQEIYRKAKENKP